MTELALLIAFFPLPNRTSPLIVVFQKEGFQPMKLRLSNLCVRTAFGFTVINF